MTAPAAVERVGVRRRQRAVSERSESGGPALLRDLVLCNSEPPIALLGIGNPGAGAARWPCMRTHANGKGAQICAQTGEAEARGKAELPGLGPKVGPFGWHRSEGLSGPNRGGGCNFAASSDGLTRGRPSAGMRVA
jgi:hypothetical protein